MRELDVRASLPFLLHRHLDGNQQVVFVKRSRHHALEKILRLDCLRAAAPAHHEAPAKRRQHGRQIGRWIGVSHVAADGPSISDRRIANLPGGFGQRRALFAQCFGQLGVRHQRTNTYDAILDDDVLQLGNAADINQRRRRSQPEFQQRDQAMSACQNLGARMFPEQIARFGDRGRAVVVEIW